MDDNNPKPLRQQEQHQLADTGENWLSMRSLSLTILQKAVMPVVIIDDQRREQTFIAKFQQYSVCLL